MRARLSRVTESLVLFTIARRRVALTAAACVGRTKHPEMELGRASRRWAGLELQKSRSSSGSSSSSKSSSRSITYEISPLPPAEGALR
uniref:Putative secreted protein n=1 Tax=Ixodes ricinus TaxID=34613 RepID=A0A6B0UBP4_IXORI